MLDGLDQEVTTVLRKAPDSTTATVSLGYRACDVPRPLDGHGYLVPTEPGRQARACTWSSSKYAGRASHGHVLLRVSLGGAGEPATEALPEGDLVAAARAEVAETLGITADPVLSRVFAWNGVMPQYTVGHPERVALAERLLASHRGVVLAGRGFHGLAVADCIASAGRAADAVLAVLAADD